MSDLARQRLCHALALAILVLGHGGLIVGLALMGEWRVWRFITNLIAQVDAALLVGWIVWQAFTVPAKADVAITCGARSFRDAGAKLWASFADWFIHGPWPFGIVYWPMVMIAGAVLVLRFSGARQGPLVWFVIVVLVGAMSALSLFSARIFLALCHTFRRHP
jgi:hypothetical protein